MENTKVKVLDMNSTFEMNSLKHIDLEGILSFFNTTNWVLHENVTITLTGQKTFLEDDNCYVLHLQK